MSVSRRRRRWLRRLFVSSIAVVAVLAVTGTAALYLDVLGARGRADRLLDRIALAIDPPPDRPIEEAVVTPRPIGSPAATPVPTATRSLAPDETPPATPAPTPAPRREPVDIDILAGRDPKAQFITELDHEWCAVAATQMVLAMHGKADLSDDFQFTLAGRIGEWESRFDSKNGGWGPVAITEALKAYGVDGYEVRIYENRQDAMVDSARALEATGAPVVLIAWRGAHSWVMTGFRAEADPQEFDNPQITGTYVLDPWYPRVSSIWGASDPPGTFQDLAEMRRNYLPWERPEGSYPARDGRFLAVVPTQPLVP